MLLDLFHPALLYKLIVCSEATCFMQFVCDPLSFVYRYKTLFFHSLKFYHILPEPQRQHIPLQLKITALPDGNGLTEMSKERLILLFLF